eukprot:5918067-Prymnesium_polylepis.1
MCAVRRHVADPRRSAPSICMPVVPNMISSSAKMSSEVLGMTILPKYSPELSGEVEIRTFVCSGNVTSAPAI